MKQVNLLRRVCVAMVMMVCVVYVAQAHDFEVDGIYYNITSETNKTVEVTYKGESYYTIIEYSGDIVVPENVSYNDTLYSVVSIGAYAFYNCGDMTSIAIPNSVTSIGKYAFSNCTGLTSVEYNAENSTMGGSVFYGCTVLSSVVIGNEVKSIPEYAFSGCSGMTSITIPNSVTSIGACAFKDCTGLVSVEYNAENCTANGSSSPLFEGCTSLSSVIFGDKVKIIPERAFQSCHGLKSITIPNSVTSIEKYAFINCTGLASVEFNAENCTTIGEYSPAFSGCTALSSVVIGDKVKTIPNYAFYDCSGLTSLIIPDSVASIGKYAFRGCTGLTSITSKNTTPPVCGSYAFKSVDINIPLIVPQESVSLYKTAYVWKDFLNIQGQDMSGVEDNFTDNGEVLMEVARYDANGKSIAAPVKGVNIVRYSNGTVKKVFEK